MTRPSPSATRADRWPRMPGCAEPPGRSCAATRRRPWFTLGRWRRGDGQHGAGHRGGRCVRGHPAAAARRAARAVRASPAGGARPARGAPPARHEHGHPIRVPLASLEAELARSAGDLEGARDIVERALAAADVSEADRYRWPLVWLGVRIEAERALVARDSGQPVPADIERRVGGAVGAREAACRRGPPPIVVTWRWCAPSASASAAPDEAAAWSSAVEACRMMNEPFPLAYALLRLGEAMADDKDEWRPARRGAGGAGARRDDGRRAARGRGAGPRRSRAAGAR